MKLAIMQPYLFPYIGYFQLMNAADEFVVYDNIQYSKKGWINRNIILVNGKEDYITFPLKKDSDYLDIKHRVLAENADQKKILNRIRESYKKAPYFNEAFPIIESAVLFRENNLFKYIFNSLLVLKEYLAIKTPLIISSDIAIDHLLKGENKVIAICKAKKATDYINPIGGVELYKKENFSRQGINLQFIKTGDINYLQFENKFIPSLSIIDVMMFNSKSEINDFLTNDYSLQ